MNMCPSQLIMINDQHTINFELVDHQTNARLNKSTSQFMATWFLLSSFLTHCWVNKFVDISADETAMPY